VLHAGDDTTIDWTAHETTKPITKVQLLYTKDGGTTYNSIITLSGAYPPENYKSILDGSSGGKDTKDQVQGKGRAEGCKGCDSGSDVSDNFFHNRSLPACDGHRAQCCRDGSSEAQSTIVTAVWLVGAVTFDHDDTIPPGSVISQNPVGSSSAPKGVCQWISSCLLGLSYLPPDPGLLPPH